MTKPRPTNEEQAFEATVENRIGAFSYKAMELILNQPFEHPLEPSVFRIWDSPLRQQFASL
ncbi:hypothetical protein LM597_04970, partial [Candidatus Acetothermia bacterium]|nr:hypothetical protein [Candidatus Acetothermia bacterium]